MAEVALVAKKSTKQVMIFLIKKLINTIFKNQ